MLVHKKITNAWGRGEVYGWPVVYSLKLELCCILCTRRRKGELSCREKKLDEGPHFEILTGEEEDKDVKLDPRASERRLER
jgi:hypothetical protein